MHAEHAQVSTWMMCGFRAVNNFIHTGVDGATPAMRLGFAGRPLEYADLLWPDEKIPRPRRSRRKGRALKL